MEEILIRSKLQHLYITFCERPTFVNLLKERQMFFKVYDILESRLCQNTSKRYANFRREPKWTIKATAVVYFFAQSIFSFAFTKIDIFPHTIFQTLCYQYLFFILAVSNWTYENPYKFVIFLTSLLSQS